MRLWDQLTEPELSDNLLHTWDGDRFVSCSWADCIAAAHEKAAALRGIGVTEGARVACVLTNSRDVCTSVLGIWLAGGTVVSLPAPARGLAPSSYVAQLRRQCEHAGAEVLLLEQRFASVIDFTADLGVEPVSYESLRKGRKITPAPPADDAVAFIQYSSGTTGEPRGCMLTTAAIASQLEMLAECLGVDGHRDRGVSWLPLSHDMGFFGFLLLPWAFGCQLALGPPERFLTSPATWAQDCADFGATITGGPSFGMKIAARAASISPPTGPLSLRSWIVGSDRIEWNALEALLRELGPHGLTPKAMMPAYGLAEATLAVTMKPSGEDPEAVSVDAAALLGGQVREASAGAEDATKIVASGSPLPGIEVRIERDPSAEDPDGPDHGLPGRESAFGEICVKSPSLAAGYLASPEKTGERFRDGELRTGDLGFFEKGQLYVVGRGDDMISVGGQNIHASELEAIFMKEPGVRPGGCALVDVLERDAGRLVVLVETKDDVSGFDELAEAMRRIAASRSGVRIEECIFVSRGTLPKTPSGKVQRFRCRELAAAEDDRVVERVKM